MDRGMIKSLIVLPGTVLIVIPAVILTVSQASRFSPKLAASNQVLFWSALLAASLGIGMSVWTVSLFVRFGAGTPAPWDPPKNLVVRGPYCHVRNPMITGVLFILMAESMIFQSWPIAVWMVVFFVGNAIYFPLVEEKGLENRFGPDYLEYKANVPRWIPRMRAWQQPLTLNPPKGKKMITVNTIDSKTFEVIVQGETTTTHRVTVTPAYYQQLTKNRVTPEVLVEKSFQFLLDRESNTSILRSFDLPVIGQYFPEYERVIKGMLD